MDFHGPIAIVLEAITRMTPEDAARAVAAIDPEDRAISEKFADSIGGWERYAKAYPTIIARSIETERQGMMGDRFRATVIGNSLVCRSHGIALYTERLM